MLLVNIIIFVVTLSILFVLITRTLKPLQLLSQSVEKIAAGDFTKLDYNYKNNDEIGHIFHSFSNMTRQLRTIIEGVKNTTDKACQMANDMKHSATDMQEKNNAVNMASNEISQGNEQIAMAMENTSVAVSDFCQSNKSASFKCLD